MNGVATRDHRYKTGSFVVKNGDNSKEHVNLQLKKIQRTLTDSSGSVKCLEVHWHENYEGYNEANKIECVGLCWSKV